MGREREAPGASGWSRDGREPGPLGGEGLTITSSGLLVSGRIAAAHSAVTQREQERRDQVLQHRSPHLRCEARWAGGQVGRRPGGQEARWAGQRQMLQMAHKELGLDSGL